MVIVLMDGIMILPMLEVEQMVENEVEVHWLDPDSRLQSQLSAQVCASFAENRWGMSLLGSRWKDVMMERGYC